MSSCLRQFHRGRFVDTPVGRSAHVAGLRRSLERSACIRRLIGTNDTLTCAGRNSVTSVSVRCRIAAFFLVFAVAGLARAELPQLDPAQTFGPDSSDAVDDANTLPSPPLFGYGLALQGNMALAGMPGAYDEKGRVAALVRNSAGKWVRFQTLTASNTPAGSGFGEHIAICNMCSLISSRTAVYIFKLQSGRWSEVGKLAFGNKRHRFEKEEPFAVQSSEGAMTLQIGEEVFSWDDIFVRESDELVLECASVNIPGDRPILRFRHDRLIVADQETPLDKLDAITGTLRGVIIPREAMGFGDVKLIAAIGAFLGWKAVLFTVASASIVGCAAAFAGVFLARDRAGARVPFGPFLAFGALFWIFGGEGLWTAYFESLGRAALFRIRANAKVL